MADLYAIGIRSLCLIGIGYLGYEIWETSKKESNMRKLQAMKQYKLSTGSDEIKDIDKQLQNHYDTHFGMKVLERMNVQGIMQDQIKTQIQRKKELRQKLLETAGNEEELKKIEEDVKKLNDLFSKVKSQTDTMDPPSYQQSPL